MKKIIIVLIACIGLFQLSSCTRVVTPGKLTLWVDRDWGCGFTKVYVNGSFVGEIRNWQNTMPMPCESASNLLSVPVYAGPVTLTFSNNCESWSENFTMNNDCFVYKVD
jgi:hypothetical protein